MCINQRLDRSTIHLDSYRANTLSESNMSKIAILIDDSDTAHVNSNIVKQHPPILSFVKV